MDDRSDLGSRLRSIPKERVEEIHAVAEIMAGIIAQRRRRGLTQGELAEMVGVKQQAIARMERGGSTPNVTTLIKVARALGLSVKLVPEAGVEQVKRARDEDAAASAVWA